MAYQTGTALNITDFVNKMLTFLVADGWARDIENHTPVAGAEPTLTYNTITRNQVFVNFRTEVRAEGTILGRTPGVAGELSTLSARLATGFTRTGTGNTRFWRQPGYSQSLTAEDGHTLEANQLVGTYYFHSGDTWFHGVVRHNDYSYSHIAFGKSDTYEDDPRPTYLSMQYWEPTIGDYRYGASSYHRYLFGSAYRQDRVDLRTHTSNIRCSTGGLATDTAIVQGISQWDYGQPTTIASMWMDLGADHLRGAIAFVPIMIQPIVSSSLRYFAGVVPGTLLCSLHGSNPEREITKNGRLYVLYPIRKKGTFGPAPSVTGRAALANTTSWEYAVAVQKIV